MSAQPRIASAVEGKTERCLVAALGERRGDVRMMVMHRHGRATELTREPRGGVVRVRIVDRQHRGEASETHHVRHRPLDQTLHNTGKLGSKFSNSGSSLSTRPASDRTCDLPLRRNGQRYDVRCGLCSAEQTFPSRLRQRRCGCHSLAFHAAERPRQSHRKCLRRPIGIGSL